MWCKLHTRLRHRFEQLVFNQRYHRCTPARLHLSFISLPHLPRLLFLPSESHRLQVSPTPPGSYSKMAPDLRPSCPHTLLHCRRYSDQRHLPRQLLTTTATSLCCRSGDVSRSNTVDCLLPHDGEMACTSHGLAPTRILDDVVVVNGRLYDAYC